MKHNFYQIDKLIDQIKDLINAEEPDNNLVAPLAREYTEICNDINGDIELIGSMMSRGEHYHALQLAKADIDLGEVITKLSFRGLDRWNQMLMDLGLEPPPEYRERGLTVLQELYSNQSSSALDEFWDDFRTYMVREEYKQARVALRSILELDPDNKDAQDTLQDMERQRFKMLFEEMASAVQAAREDEVWGLIPKIHHLREQGFAFGPNQEQIWHRAKLLEVNSWLRQLNDFRARGHWTEVLRLNDGIEKSVASNRLQLQPATQSEVNEAVKWANSQKHLHEESTAFKGHYDHLQDLHGQARLPGRDTELLSEEKVLQELEILGQAWSQLHQFPDELTGTIAPEINDFQRQRTLALQAKATKCIRDRHRKIAVACVIFIVGLGVASWKITTARNAEAFAKQLNGAVKSRAYGSVTNIYYDGKNRYPSPPAVVLSALNDANKFMTNAVAEFQKLELLVVNLESKTNSLSLTNSPAFERDLFSTSNQLNSLTNIALQIGDPLDIRVSGLGILFLNFRDKSMAKGETQMRYEMEAINRQISTNFFKPTADLESLRQLLNQLEEEYSNLRKYDQLKEKFSEDTKQRKNEIRGNLDKQAQQLSQHQGHLRALDSELGEMELKEALKGLLNTGLLLPDEKKEIEFSLAPLNSTDHINNLQEKFIWTDRKEFRETAENNRGDLFPFSAFLNPTLADSLRKVSKNIYIYEVQMVPRVVKIEDTNITTAYLAKIDGNKWQPFHVTGNMRGRAFEQYNNVDWNKHKDNLVKPKPVAQNEVFEDGNNGLDKDFLVKKGDEWPIEQSPFLYLSSLCKAISEEDMEPILGLWKIHQFIETIFPKESNNKNGRCALGLPVIQYGVTQAFMATLHKDIDQAWGEELPLRKKLWGWTQYHDLEKNQMKKLPEYLGLKQRVINFAKRYRDSHEQLKAVRDVYLQLLNDGDPVIEYSGHLKKDGSADYGPKLLTRNKARHLIALTKKEADWIMVPQNELKNAELMPFSPVYSLGIPLGTEAKPLPETLNDWHEFPKIIIY